MPRDANSCHCFIEKKLDEYKSYLAGTSLSNLTITAYVARIEQFHLYCCSFEIDHNNNDRDIWIELINHYCDYLSHVRNLKQGSINCAVTAIDQFFTHFGIGLPKRNRPRSETPLRLIGKVEQQKLSNAIARCPSTKFRALVNLFLYTGLRVGELRMLRLEDLELSEQSAVYVRFGAVRAVPIPSRCKIALLKWLNERDSYLKGLASEMVFPNTDGRPMSLGSIDAAVRTVARGAQLNVSGTVLRNTYIQTLLEQQLELNIIAYLAGFKRIDSMSRFLELRESKTKTQCYLDARLGEDRVKTPSPHTFSNAEMSNYQVQKQ